METNDQQSQSTDSAPIPTQFEQCFRTSKIADETARWMRRLKKFEDLPYWKRLLKGGFITHAILKYVADWYFEEYLWEQMSDR